MPFVLCCCQVGGRGLRGRGPTDTLGAGPKRVVAGVERMDDAAADEGRVRPVRSGPLLLPDVDRVLARPFVPGEWNSVAERPRISVVIERVLAIPDAQVESTLRQVVARFGDRHRDLDAVLVRHAGVVVRSNPGLDDLDGARLRLLGAFFTQEYAVEAAALTNPSMVPAPWADAGDDGALPDDDGALPIVLSARAIGEGHVSSIVFRRGRVHADGRVEITPPGPHLEPAARAEPEYDRAVFSRQLVAEGADADVVARLLRNVPDRLSMEQLEGRLHAFTSQRELDTATHEAVRLVHWLASANYRATFPPDSRLDARVLFPVGPTESRGMEDARFTRVDDDGRTRYLATYTAYDGFSVRPQLLETDDFLGFRSTTIGGDVPPGKGMAIFPRRVDGRWMAVVRPDHETIAVAASDHLREWSERPTAVARPGSAPWDLVQLGNNGSPIETEAGWLVLTHGVGPMRRYALGALLLDRDDPTRPLGYLPDPLLEPAPDERDGYVPNVVYSCGGLVHAGRLVVPYGTSDRGTAAAAFPLDRLLEALTSSDTRRGGI